MSVTWRSGTLRGFGWTLVAAGLLLTGCGDEAAPGATAAEEEARDPLGGLRLDTIGIIGPEVGIPATTLGGVWDVAVAPDGTIALLDSQAPAVHLFNGEGGFIASIAARGQAPGALTRPYGVGWNSEGDLFVWDPLNARVSRYAVGASEVTFIDSRAAAAFGETGFCVLGERVYLSVLQDDRVVHEIASTGGIARSFSEAPPVVGIEGVAEEARPMALEDFSPSRLLCLPNAGQVLEVSFFQARVRLHDADGNLLWSREASEFVPVLPVSPDGMGVGFQLAEETGSHMARSVVPWGAGRALVQYEVRIPRATTAGADELRIESRLIRLDTGDEEARTRVLPLFIAASGNRLFQPVHTPEPRLLLLERP